MKSLWPRAIVWLGVQLVPLIVGVLGWPLWARYPQPREHATLALVVSTQLIAPAAMASWLLIDRNAWMLVCMTASLFELLASIASNHAPLIWLACSSALLLWLTFLFAASRLLQSTTSHAWCSAIALALAMVSIAAEVSRLL